MKLLNGYKQFLFRTLDLPPQTFSSPQPSQTQQPLTPPFSCLAQKPQSSLSPIFSHIPYPIYQQTPSALGWKQNQDQITLHSLNGCRPAQATSLSHLDYCNPHFWPRLSGKKVFHFNFLIQSFIYLYLDTCFLYYKGTSAFIF